MLPISSKYLVGESLHNTNRTQVCLTGILDPGVQVSLKTLGRRTACSDLRILGSAVGGDTGFWTQESKSHSKTLGRRTACSDLRIPGSVDTGREHPEER